MKAPDRIEFTYRGKKLKAINVIGCGYCITDENEDEVPQASATLRRHITKLQKLGMFPKDKREEM